MLTYDFLYRLNTRQKKPYMTRLPIYDLSGYKSKLRLSMTLRKAEILFKDQPAGTLEETVSGGSRFIYAPQWQTQIACSLPLLRREHEWAQGVHPFFQHLGPEGWLREKQARAGHIAEEDDFGLLLRYGADCIGAVGVRPLPGAATQDTAPVSEATAS